MSMYIWHSRAINLPSLVTPVFTVTLAGWRVTVLKLSLIESWSFTGRRVIHVSAAEIGSALT